MNYQIKKVTTTPEFKGLFNGESWKDANTIKIDNFRKESSSHHPETFAKLAYDESGIYGIFLVKDKYIKSVHQNFCDPVCKDSCVELFISPNDFPNYINFEFNCGGTLLSSFVTNPTRDKDGTIKSSTRLTKEDVKEIKIFHSMPKVVNPEITEQKEWTLEFFIPFSLFKKFFNDVSFSTGKTWRANLYKCGDETSHPHWASWSPVDELNFHLPRCFGNIEFK